MNFLQVVYCIFSL